MTLLLTGYEPFGDHESNPSGRVARDLDGETVEGHDVVGRVLPVEFDAVGPRMCDLIAEHDPAAVVATGLSAGRTAVNVERVGINVDDCVGLPDNADANPHDERIAPDGPAAYLATLPATTIVESLLDRGIPARLSNTAGTHLCNHVLFETLRYLDDAGRDRPAGFIHLPSTPEQAAAEAEEPARGGSVDASLPLSLQREAVVTAFETALQTE